MDGDRRRKTITASTFAIDCKSLSNAQPISASAKGGVTDAIHHPPRPAFVSNPPFRVRALQGRGGDQHASRPILVPAHAGRDLRARFLTTKQLSEASEGARGLSFGKSRQGDGEGKPPIARRRWCSRREAHNQNTRSPIFSFPGKFSGGRMSRPLTPMTHEDPRQ